MDYKMHTKTETINLTPHVLSRISETFYKSAKNYDLRDTPLVNLFLYGASIEIGLKSAILSKDNSMAKKCLVRYKIRHDLNMAVKEFNRDFNNKKIITTADLVHIQKLNKYYKNKGLEYCTGDVIYSLSSGGSGFPKISEIEKITEKIIRFIKRNDYWIHV